MTPAPCALRDVKTRKRGDAECATSFSGSPFWQTKRLGELMFAVLTSSDSDGFGDVFNLHEFVADCGHVGGVEDGDNHLSFKDAVVGV